MANVYFNFKHQDEVIFQPHWSQPWHIVINDTYMDLFRKIHADGPKPVVYIETVCGKRLKYWGESSIQSSPARKRKVCEDCIVEAYSYQPIQIKWVDDGFPF